MFEPAECACTHAGCVCAIQATRSEHACGFVSLVYKLQSAEIERSWRWYRWLPLVRKVRGIFVLTRWRRKHRDQTSVKWDTTHQSVAAETSLHQHGLISSSWLRFGGCCSCRWPVSCVFLGLPVVLPELSFKCHRCTVTHSSRAVNNVSHLDVDSVSALQLLRATYLHTDHPPPHPPSLSLPLLNALTFCGLLILDIRLLGRLLPKPLKHSRLRILNKRWTGVERYWSPSLGEDGWISHNKTHSETSCARCHQILTRAEKCHPH